MAESAHVLVVANRTAESDELLAVLNERAARSPSRFTLLVPATPHGVAWAADMHSGGEEAKAHMDKAVGRLRDDGLEVEGVLGDPDPVAAVQDVVNTGAKLRRGDRLHAADAPVQVAQARPAAPRGARRRGSRCAHVVEAS